MTNEKDSVFPIVVPSNADREQLGLTKREYFAAVALQGIIAAHNIYETGIYHAVNAKSAVEAADELMKALNETQEQNEWTILDDGHNNMPTEDGWYWVEMSVGSINRKIELRAVYYKAHDRRFNGEFDWNFAIRWMPITPPKRNNNVD